MWKQLKDSESAIDRNNAKQLNRREVFYSLVYIINDDVNKNNVGKIKVFKYGKKLRAKLDRYLNPEGGSKVDIFNFYTGYNFDLKITRQGNFNDYDSAGFEIQPTMIPLEGMTGDDSDRDILSKFMESAPNLDEYRYKAWDEAQREKLERILNMYRSPGSSVDAIVNEKGSTETPVATVSAQTTNTTTETTNTTPEPQAKTASANTTNTTENTGGDDEQLNEFLEGLGI